MTKEKRPILISVLALATMMQAAIAISPVLAELADAFPNASTSQIQYVYTIAFLASIVSILAVGKLAQAVNNRLLAVVGIALVVIGGLIPVLIHTSLVILYIASFIIGIGSGVANVMSATLISQHFTGITKGTVMGYQSAFLSIGASHKRTACRTSIVAYGISYLSAGCAGTDSGVHIPAFGSFVRGRNT